MKILFFIGTLKTGGAERQISVLINGFSDRGHRVKVVTLFPGGIFADELGANPDVEVISLWPKKHQNTLFTLFQILWAPFLLRRLINGTEIVYSMLEVTNFIAWISTRFLVDVNLVWGLRASTIGTTWKMTLFNNFCTFVSPSVRLIIINSHKGLETYSKQGYRSQRIRVIPNGIDVAKFNFDQDARFALRKKHSIPSNHNLIGIVARIVPMKDHTTFFEAAALIAEQTDQVCFMVVGDGPADYVKVLLALIEELGLKDRVIWFGNRNDVIATYSAMDVLVSSSAYGEGFSNVIGEAMSCGVPCVVTDVGDSARIVGDPSRVVRPKDPEGLAKVIFEVLQQDDRSRESERLRSRIIENYSLQILIESTEKALNALSFSQEGR